MSRPPSTAPGRLPMPPTTAAVKAKSPAWKPMYGHACGSCKRGADEERHDDDAVDVDPHHRRGFLVEGRGAHRLAGLRALHEHGEQHHEDDRADDDDHLWKPD